MIFDNADDPLLSIGDFFPQGNHGGIIIPSRIPGLSLLAPEPASDCTVLRMYPDEALALLLKTARLQGKSMSEAEHNAAVRLLQV
jgi:hypothetical protein